MVLVDGCGQGTHPVLTAPHWPLHVFSLPTGLTPNYYFVRSHSPGLAAHHLLRDASLTPDCTLRLQSHLSLGGWVFLPLLELELPGRLTMTFWALVPDRAQEKPSRLV